MRTSRLASFFVGLALCARLLDAAQAQEPEDTYVWPQKAWTKCTPDEAGFTSAGLTAVADFALQHGGGSGCIVRRGRLVHEWGSSTARFDIKSATKGSIGTTLLGLAVGDGLVRIDDRARKHYPTMGEEKKANLATDWLDDITIHQLATMTAGFDQGRPPLLVHRPGTRGIYSNDTANMLAELLTLRFGEDLKNVLERRVMRPLGIDSDDWTWRDNSYRPKQVGGLASREFASGMRITHGALARIGYLYLREGNWRGQQILSKELVRAATRPTDLPAPFAFYGMYWGTNGRGTFADLPNDAFWAHGLGDSFVLVCPSMDLVVVRLGAGSLKSHFPGGNADDDWGRRVEGFMRLVKAALKSPPASTKRSRGNVR